MRVRSIKILLGVCLCAAGFSLFGEAKETESFAEGSAGTVLREWSGEEEALEDCFRSRKIEKGDEIYQRIAGKSYRENEDIGLEDLRYLTLLHYNFDHEVQIGEMIVHEKIAEDVLEIFEELFREEYEIQSMLLIDHFWTGNPDSTDTASTMANNTSCFNYREITGGGTLSNHALGLAIDVNPIQNPYVWYDEAGNRQCLDENARPYLDRSLGDPHMIAEGDVCWTAFQEHGFEWGGAWSSPVDYQHFELCNFPEDVL